MPTPSPVRRLAATVAALVLASLLVGTVGTAAQTRRVPGQLNGVDVSQWQATIDWPTVAGTSTRFVIMRATKAHDYVDPTYATNLAGATDAGVVVGSYHRATPSRQDGDARREADHFLEVARNAPGDLLPVLDIEETGGQSPAEMVGWVRRWVERVRDVLGVRPMLYASPYFWRTRMGDSTWFAEHGYPLWIAHWGVVDPDVPAGNWDGNGYVVHQWTSSGHVDGIPTRVDRDRFPGSSLRTGRIAEVQLTPSPGGRVTGARLSCGRGETRCARRINPGDELTLTADPSQDAVLLGWKGACASAGTSPTCTVTAYGTVKASAVFGFPVDVATTGSGAGSVTSDPAGVACPGDCAMVAVAASQVELTAAPDSASAFDEWRGACAGTTPTCVVTVGGARHLTARFDATTQLDQDDPGTSHRWGSARDDRAAGGKYLVEHLPGASTTFGFTGGTVTLDAVHGPAAGVAQVLVDSLEVGRFNQCEARFAIRHHRFDGLGAGPHDLTIAVLDRRPHRCDATRVGLDALRWGGALHANPIPTAATWAERPDAGALGGSVATSDTPGAEARLSFTGTGVTLLTVRGPRMGVVDLRVDGEPLATWDLSSTTRAFVRRTVTGLDDGDHVVRLIVSGERGAHGAHGRSLAVDGWIVR